jgi:hypothetical protein
LRGGGRRTEISRTSLSYTGRPCLKKRKKERKEGREGRKGGRKGGR